MLDGSWTGFFAAEVGATAALAGLVIVAISINIARILSFPQLPGRAADTLIILAGALLLSSLMLFPADALPRAALLVVAGIVWLWPVAMQIHEMRAPGTKLRAWMAWRILLAQIPALPMLAGCAMVAAGQTSGVTWLAVSVLLALVAAMLNTWVLLVEILR